MIVLLLSLLCSCNKIADTAAELMFSDEEEIKIGNNFSKQIEAEPGFTLYTKNPAFVKYVDSLGQSIVSVQHRTIPYYFKVVDNDSVVNAFAIPGGHVYIYSGLAKKVKSEDELAGVLAHEIAHISQRHGVKTIIKNNFYSTVADLLLGEDSQKWANFLDTFRQLKNSRDMEYEADSCAVTFSAEAKQNPLGMKNFLGTLKDMGNSIPDIISTHPDTEKRIEYVQEVIDRNHQEATTLYPLNDLAVKP